MNSRSSSNPNPDSIETILDQFRSGAINAEHAAQRLRRLQSEPLGFATVDLDRKQRCGVGEVIFAEGKLPQQVVDIARTILDRESRVLITRAQPAHADAVQANLNSYPIEYGERSGTLIIGSNQVVERTPIPIVTAGTSDQPVAEEALLSCKALGHLTVEINDIGVAGLHRVGNWLKQLRSARAIICIAGMEGALPSVIGGLVHVPVIAVPTHVGYGASFGGLAALLGMLTSCASGVVVVNIDNGFGAAYAACLINGRPARNH